MNGPIRTQLGVNCGSNCFGQGNRVNATIGRAVQLSLLNIGGAKPGEMDRSTQGSPAKYTFCFGENEEESPWELPRTLFLVFTETERVFRRRPLGRTIHFPRFCPTDIEQ